MTIGQMMFVGGIAGAAGFSVMLTVLLATAGKRRRKLLDKIAESYADD